MKKLTLALIVASLFGCAVTPPSKEPVTIKESTDKYSGINEISTSPIKIDYQYSLRLLKFEDKSVKGLSAVMLTYDRNSAYDGSSRATKWQFLKNRQGYLMIDNKPYSLGEGKHSGDSRIAGAGGVYLLETVSFIFKPEMIGRLVSAKTIGGRVGDSEFTLTPDQVKTVNEFSLKAI